MAVTALLQGDPTRIGAARVIARLGEGGMGIVYLGVFADGTRVAIKRVRPELATDPGFKARFAREAAALTAVDHGGTARVLAVDMTASPPYLITEYVAGPTLVEAVTNLGPLPEAAVVDLAPRLLAALKACHAAGVVHRDVKPANVVLAQVGPRIIDFGIAAMTDATELTRTGALLGSPGWMSPEQLTAEQVSSASDVFGWAGVIAYAATGRAPFGTGNPTSVAYRVVHNDPDLVGVPASMLPALTAAMSKTPTDRPTIDDLLDTLSAPGTGSAGAAAHWPTLAATAITDETAVLHTHDPAKNSTRRSGRGKWWAAGAATVAIGTVSTILLTTAAAGGATDSDSDTSTPPASTPTATSSPSPTHTPTPQPSATTPTRPPSADGAVIGGGSTRQNDMPEGGWMSEGRSLPGVDNARPVAYADAQAGNGGYLRAELIESRRPDGRNEYRLLTFDPVRGTPIGQPTRTQITGTYTGDPWIKTGPSGLLYLPIDLSPGSEGMWIVRLGSDGTIAREYGIDVFEIAPPIASNQVSLDENTEDPMGDPLVNIDGCQVMYLPEEDTFVGLGGCD